MKLFRPLCGHCIGVCVGGVSAVPVGMTLMNSDTHVCAGQLSAPAQSAEKWPARVLGHRDMW